MTTTPNGTRLSVGGSILLLYPAANTNYFELRSGLSMIGKLNLLPERRTRLCALKTALPDVYPAMKGMKHLVEPVPGGYQVVRASKKEKKEVGDTFGRVVAIATISEKTGAITVTPDDIEKKLALAAAVERIREFVPGSAVKKALAEEILNLNGVAFLQEQDLRKEDLEGDDDGDEGDSEEDGNSKGKRKRKPRKPKTGMAYWLMAADMPEFDDVLRVFMAASSSEGPATKVRRLNVEADADMVETIGHFLTAEVKELLAKIEKEIESVGEDGGLGVEACENRLIKASQASRKVEKYAEAFGVPFQELTAACKKAAAECAKAALIAGAAQMASTAAQDSGGAVGFGAGMGMGSAA